MSVNFVTDGTLDRIIEPRSRTQHMEDIRRECFRHKIKHLSDDAECAADFCRDLMQSGADVTEELNELQIAANGLMLVAALLNREAEKSNG